MQRRFYVLFNSRAGTAATTGLTAGALQTLLEQAGLDCIIDDDDSELGERLQRALASDVDTIVAAGGDGTVLAVAEALAGTDKTLALLPLGTFNALARDLKLPLNLEAAIKAMATLEERDIDFGEVNGRVFLHNVLIGVIPGIAVGREHIRTKAGLMSQLAFLRFFIRRLARSRPLALALEYEAGNTAVTRLKTLVVANNSYEQRIGGFMSRRRIDRGTLTVYKLRTFGLGDVVRLATRMLAGRWRDDPSLEFTEVKHLTVHSKRPRLLVTVDGEILTLETPLRFQVREKGLRVLAPPVEPAVAAEETVAIEA